MSFPSYSGYHESGAEWLGAIPSHWKAQRLKTIFEIKKRVAGREGFDVLSITQNGIRVRDVESNEGQLATTYANYQIVEPGDFAMNQMDLLTGWVDIASQQGVTSPDYRVFSLRPQVQARPKYLLYLLQNAYTHRIFFAFGQGSSHLGRWRLPTDAFQDFVLPLPPEPEQIAIAEFLDRETAKIDELIAEQKRLIALLDEKRQVVITHAVTKGLNPHARVKDSGLDWLGDVPSHWSVEKVGRRYDVQLGRMLNQDRSQGDHLRPYLRVLDVQWDSINVSDLPLMDFPPIAQVRYRLRPGDLLVNEGGSYVGRSAIWRGELDECYYQKALHRLRPLHSEKDTAEFLLFVMEMATQRGVFVAEGNQTTIDHLTAEQFRATTLAFPPLSEQIDIAAKLRSQLNDFRQLKATADTAISLLLERRATLISAAVTGKIDVRSQGAVPSLSKPDLRLIVGSAFVGSLARRPRFGRVKFQKLLFLTEAHAGIDLGGKYTREAAGPFDRNLVADVERRLAQAGKVDICQPEGAGGQVEYRPTSSETELETELAQLPQPAAKRLKTLIGLFADLDTRFTEAVTTLYAVWNDSLIDGRQPTTNDIIDEVLNGWHPEKKQKFRADELETWLGWMDRHGLVPTGSGPKTQLGRLFA